MGRLNHHELDNGDVEVYPSYYSLEYPFDYVPEPDNTLNKYINDDEMEQIPESFPLDKNSDILDIDLQMLQD